MRKKRVSRWISAACLTLCILFVQGPVRAQSTPSPSVPACTAAADSSAPNGLPCLTTLVQTFTQDKIFLFSGLDLGAAEADDAAYAALLRACTGAATCHGAQLNLFMRLRELEENAGQLLGFGPTFYSLNLSAQGMSDALRWTADEEFAAQSSMTSRFANNQSAAVSDRLSNLRFMQAVRLAWLDGEASNGLLANFTPDGANGDGGGAGDPQSAQFGRWSVFANSSYGAGTKAPTMFDDAFSFGSTQVSVGADARISPHAIVGFLVNHVLQEADFNSSESIAAGGITSSGYGLTSYVQFDWDAAYLNFSLGGQRVSLDTTRVVAYPSNNPLIPSVDTTFHSSTDATSLLLSGGGGYLLHTHGFSAEPYLNAQYLHTHIDAFTESASGPDLGFAASAASQGITSLVGAAGMKFQYVFEPSFAVILPYVYGEYRHEFRNPSQDVGSQFGAAPAGDYFQLPTDDIDPNYYQVGAGLSAVLPHGAQLYLEYLKVLHLEYYTDYVASGGFRFEF